MHLKEIGTGIVRRVEYHQNTQCVDIQHDGESSNITHGYHVTKSYAALVQGWIGKRVMISTGPSEGPAYDELELELLPESAPIHVPNEIATLRKKYEELVETRRWLEHRAHMSGASAEAYMRSVELLQDRCLKLTEDVSSLTRDNGSMRHQLDVIRKALP